MRRKSVLLLQIDIMFGCKQHHCVSLNVYTDAEIICSLSKEQINFEMFLKMFYFTQTNETCCGVAIEHRQHVAALMLFPELIL